MSGIRLGLRFPVHKFAETFSHSSASTSTRRLLIGGTALLSAVAYSNWSNPPCAAAASPSTFLYSWGANRYGQLGVGSEIDASLPTAVDGLPNVRMISCGAEQTAVIGEDGKLYTFGRGQDRRLGHGGSGGVNESHPRLVEELADKTIVAVDAGFSHMACITSDGELWTWGNNSCRQLGHDGGDYPRPVQKLKDLGVVPKQAALGRFHTCVLAEDGTVWAWGGLKSGETGTGKKKTIAEPSQVAISQPVVLVAAGQDFSLFLGEDGSLYSCGANDQGQTGHGAKGERYILTPKPIRGLDMVSSMAAGQLHAVACTTDGRVFTWGKNQDGQLGHGDKHNRTTPSEVLFFRDNELFAEQCAAGGGHTAVIARNRDGQRWLYIFGRGRQGQIGRADEVESVAAYRPTPVAVNYFNVNDRDIVNVSLGYNHSAAMVA